MILRKLTIGFLGTNLGYAALLRQLIERHTSHQWVWQAGNLHLCIDLCQKSVPNIILLDIADTSLDAVLTVADLRRQFKTSILLMYQSTECPTHRVFAALGAGAIDVVNLCMTDQQPSTSLVQAFVEKITLINKLTSESGHNDLRLSIRPARSAAYPLVAIGASAGGPAALVTLLKDLPRDMNAAFVIVQHIESIFARNLAQWLNEQCSLTVKIAQSGDVPEPGVVLIAGTEDHLVLTPKIQLEYIREPTDYAYRPSVDVFFNSAVAYWPDRLIGVLLTGMGRDGALGMRAIHTRGMQTLVQNQESCAVFGMPKAAIELHAAHPVVDIREMSTELKKILGYQAPEEQLS